MGNVSCLYFHYTVWKIPRFNSFCDLTKGALLQFQRDIWKRSKASCIENIHKTAQQLDVAQDVKKRQAGKESSNLRNGMLIFWVVFGKIIWKNIPIDVNKCENMWIYLNICESRQKHNTKYHQMVILSQICGRWQIQNWPLPLEDIHHQDLQNISVYYICIAILYITILHTFGVNNIPLICRDAFQNNFRKINPMDLQVYVDSSQRCLTGLAWNDVMVNQPPQLPCTTCTRLAHWRIPMDSRSTWRCNQGSDLMWFGDFAWWFVPEKPEVDWLKFGVLGSCAPKRVNHETLCNQEIDKKDQQKDLKMAKTTVLWCSDLPLEN